MADSRIGVPLTSNRCLRVVSATCFLPLSDVACTVTSTPLKMVSD
jgi:hypothetical protein